MIGEELPAGIPELRLFRAGPVNGSGSDGVILRVPRGDAGRAAVLAEENRELRLCVRELRADNRRMASALEQAEDELDRHRETIGMWMPEVPL